MTKPILAKRFNVRGIEKALQDEMRELSRASTKLMEATTLTFRRVDPDFLIEEANREGDLVYSTGPADNRDGRIWMFLDKGTDVRFAIVSFDFIPKTAPDRLVPGPGAGRIIGFSQEPLPGIEARNFTLLIATLIQKDMEVQIPKSLKSVAKYA